MLLIEVHCHHRIPMHNYAKNLACSVTVINELAIGATCFGSFINDVTDTLYVIMKTSLSIFILAAIKCITAWLFDNNFIENVYTGIFHITFLYELSVRGFWCSIKINDFLFFWRFLWKNESLSTTQYSNCGFWKVNNHLVMALWDADTHKKQIKQ